ncbi:hypothetical protein DD238_006298 [Peronospora effusa]|uniref:RxLR effector candidate protein n=1 Tax=Peronospora effusa TaxID=542832 RepID=A0A3M6VQT3_9STRA|nr:hypothetical protein DD238_006298 [Peronospora effusa]RQM14815.1 hypothetical protein DD237_006186 [Peronospora effusa]
MIVTSLYTTLLLSVVLVENPVHAEVKSRPDNTCRSAGVLKFDLNTHPMQRVRRNVVISFPPLNTNYEGYGSLQQVSQEHVLQCHTWACSPAVREAT